MKKVKELLLHNPGNEREKILVFRTYRYFYIEPGETTTVEVETDKEFKHYKEVAKIHDLELKLNTKNIDEEEPDSEEDEEIEEELEEDEVEEDVEETVIEEEIEEEESEGEDEVEEEIEETDIVQEEEVEPEDKEEEDEVKVKQRDLQTLEEKLYEFEPEVLQELADKFNITTYNASKKDTLIKWIMKQADQLPLEEI